MTSYCHAGMARYSSGSARRGITDSTGSHGNCILATQMYDIFSSYFFRVSQHSSQIRECVYTYLCWYIAACIRVFVLSEIFFFLFVTRVFKVDNAITFWCLSLENVVVWHLEMKENKRSFQRTILIQAVSTGVWSSNDQTKC